MFCHTNHSAILTIPLAPCLALVLSNAASGQGTRQVADINKVKIPQNSNPSPNRSESNNYREARQFAKIGPRAYFSATSPITGEELYASIGTPNGGALIKDINPGTRDSKPSHLTVVGNKIYFSADDGKNGRELWVTDGTSQGTRMVADLNKGVGDGDPTALCPLGGSGKIVFTANAAGAPGGLYVSDGTAKGTVLLNNIAPGWASSYQLHMRTFNNGKKDLVVFSAITTASGRELWITDGTTAGTKLLKDINPGSSDSSPMHFQVLGKKVIFDAYTAKTGRDLWVTDGSATGTTLVKDLTASRQDRVYLYGGIPLLGKYYFEVHDGARGAALYVTNGTTAGTQRIKDSSSGYARGLIRDGVALGTKIFYNGFGWTSAYEPWVLDTTTNTASLLLDIISGSGSSGPSSFAVLGKKVLFSATSPKSGRELYISDGTATGTKLLKDIYLGAMSSDCSNLTSLSTNRVIFGAKTLLAGKIIHELWGTDGTVKGTIRIPVAWKTTPTAGSNPAFVIPLNGKLYFSADDGTRGAELWVSDGTSAGTALVKDIFPGKNNQQAPNSSSPKYLARIGNRFVFSADDGKGNGRELWTSDGTAKGTKLLKILFAGPASSNPSHMKRIGNKAYFTAHGYDESKPRRYVGSELWVTDGTAGGTRLVADINPGRASSDPRDFTEVGHSGRFVFSATGPSTTGRELYISDGTSSGTKLLKDLNPGSRDSLPRFFTGLGAKVYFAADEQNAGSELWSTDGTAAGTASIKVPSSRGGTSPSQLQSQGGKLYFAAFSNYWSSPTGKELWISDGTSAGTKLFKDIRSGSSSANPAHITAAGSRHLYFAATGSTSTGNELWKSDLTNTGTVLHTDIWQGPPSSFASVSYYTRLASSLTVMTGKVFFAAKDPAGGMELWCVDNGATATRFGDACKSSYMSGTDPVLGGTAKIAGTTRNGFSANVVLLGIRSPTALPMGGECRLHLNPLGPLLIVGASAGTSYAAGLAIPNIPRLMGLQMALQTVHIGNSFPAGSGFSNGLSWTLGR